MAVLRAAVGMGRSCLSGGGIRSVWMRWYSRSSGWKRVRCSTLAAGRRSTHWVGKKWMLRSWAGVIVAALSLDSVRRSNRSMSQATCWNNPHTSVFSVATLQNAWRERLVGRSKDRRDILPRIFVVRNCTASWKDSGHRCCMSGRTLGRMALWVQSPWILARRLDATTSTGGMTAKLPGRIGDTTCAVSGIGSRMNVAWASAGTAPFSSHVMFRSNSRKVDPTETKFTLEGTKSEVMKHEYASI